MFPPVQSDTRLFPRLPLPVARLARRSQNAKSAKDRHDTAWFAFEVSVRLGVAAVPPADARALARGSLGAWTAALRGASGALAQAPLLELHALFTSLEPGRASSRSALDARGFLDAMVHYRNQVIGHGSQRSESFYDRAADLLIAGLDAAWRAGLFLPENAALRYVESVELDPGGEPRARVFDLTGEAPRLLEPARVPRDVSFRPRTLYVELAQGWAELFPWCLYDEERERLLCFNGLGRRAQFLDYASGTALSGAELEAQHPGVTDALRLRLDTSVQPSRSAAAPEAESAERVADCLLLGEIGAGRTGRVLLARQESLDRLVAVKVLSAQERCEPEDLARFEREIDALARCEHPNVVKVLSRGRLRGAPYFVMEFIEGADLQRVQEHLANAPDLVEAVRAASAETAERLPVRRPVRPASATGDSTLIRPSGDRWQQLARFFAEAADGLHHLHRRGILHRDVRPANILATLHATRPVIMDLGFAAVDGQTLSAADVQRPARSLVAERYQAPEVLQRDLLPVDARCDVYSLGAVLYEFCTGAPLFPPDDPRMVLAILRTPPRDPRELRPDLPEELAAILRKSLAKNPDERQASAADLAVELRRFAQGTSTAVAPASAAPAALTRAPAARRRVLLAAGVLLVAAVVAAWLLLRTG